jgi:hypothetical protein
MSLFIEKNNSTMPIDNSSSSSSNNHIITDVPSKGSNCINTFIMKCEKKSPCQFVPCYLVPNNFFAKQNCFDIIYKLVTNALEKLMNTYKYCIDYTYFPTSTQWKITYFKDSDLREIHLNCYWNDNANDHVIEMNRVYGDGFYPITNDVYENVRKSVLQENYTPPVIVPGRRPIRCCPPPMLLKKAIESGAIPKIPPVTEEQFLKGIMPIFRMASDQFFESRLNASMSLCNMAKRDTKMLTLQECQENVNYALNALIADDFEIRRFAIYAFSLFSTIPAYKINLGKIPNLYILADVLLNKTNLDAYLIANVRRRACIAFNELIPYHKDLIRALFEERGITNTTDLDIHCSSISIPVELIDDLKQIFV